MPEEDPQKTRTTEILIAVAVLLLGPPATDLYEGKPVLLIRTILFALAGFAALFFAAYPYIPRVPKAMVERIRASLSPIWLVVVLLLWTYLVAPGFIARIHEAERVVGQPVTVQTQQTPIGPTPSGVAGTELSIARLRIADLEHQVRQLSQPTPSLSPSPPPHKITVEQALDFIDGFRRLWLSTSGSECQVTVTAAPDNQDLREQLVTLMEFPGRLVSAPTRQNDAYLRYRTAADARNYVSPTGPEQPSSLFNGFKFIDTVPPPIPPAPAFDSDATPPPTPKPILFPKGYIVVASPDGFRAEIFVQLLQMQLHLRASTGMKYPADANRNIPGLMYVQIGSGSLWTQ